MVHLTSFLAPQVLLLLYLATPILAVDHYTRADFPADFVFGSGTAAPQYEGASFEDGRTASIWDTFFHPGGPEGNVGCDGYHKYKGDVELMGEIGLEAFRISISWSRLIPNGRGPVNAKGLQYYNNLINELISNGIQPHITLSHIDLPQALQDAYGGWLNRTIVKDFLEYANVCFKEFGDRVLHWTTLNEVNVAATGGYDQGIVPPGRCSTRSTCLGGDSTTEPYLVVHNMLLAHSAVAKLYKDKYKGTSGKIGLNIYTFGFAPYTNSIEDVMATQRIAIFYIGWVLDPIFFGDYPDIMKKRAQTRIPTFTKHEMEQLKDSLDFIGLNYYTSIYAKDDTSMGSDIKDFFADLAVEMICQMSARNGTLNDTSRVNYLQTYIGAVLDAVRNGSNINGYFQWAFLDCVELLDISTAFGLYYVDLNDKESTRYKKLSAVWYSSFLKGKSTERNAITQVGADASVSLI